MLDEDEQKEYRKLIKMMGWIEMKRPSYKKAFSILMEYWECLPDDQKKDIDKRLTKEAGV